MSLETLHDAGASGVGDNEIVDIVAIHSLAENSKETWSHSYTGKNWLKDFLPSAANSSIKARILSYGYRADPSILLEDDAANGALQQAHTLVSRLQADRGLTDTSQRPLIFICHGFGGIIVKKALAYSATQVSQKVSHNYSIYVSTFGIIFLGTPHNGYESAFVRLFAQLGKDSARLKMLMGWHQQCLQAVTDQFAPLAKQFHIYLFWEQHRTKFGHIEDYVVREDSAAPMWDNVERSGCSANHSHMCKFADESSPEYKTVLEALIRYSRGAPASIAERWRNANKFIQTQRSIEAAELIGFDVHDNNRPYVYLNSPKIIQGEFRSLQNQHFHVPHNVSHIYTGRGQLRWELHQKLLKPSRSSSPPRLKVFVLYGLGGSGKTQFCLKFVEEYRNSFWAVFWIDASSTETAERALSFIGKTGGLGKNHQAGVHWLAGLKLPWMLVIDNADDPTINYSRFFPTSGQGHILLTSRLHDCKSYATVGSYEFRDMSEEDAILLLLKAADEDTKSNEARETAKRIAKALGYLPLALTHAGAAIRQNICSLAEYLDLYKSHRSDLLKRRIVLNNESHHYSIFAVFDVTVQRIESDKSRIAKDAIEILQILAFLHFEQIPTSIFARAWNNIQQNPTILPPKTILMRFCGVLDYVASDLVAFENLNTGFPWSWYRYRLPDLLCEKRESWNSLRFREAIAMLENHSLLFQAIGSKGMYSMHPLVQHWARSRLSPSEQRLWTDIAINTLAASISPDLNAGDEALRISLVPHITSCLQGEHACTLLSGRVNRYQISKAAKFAKVYSEGGNWKQAVQLQELILSTEIISSESFSISKLDVMMALASSYWNLGQLGKSLKLHTEAVDSGVAALGAEHTKTLRAKDSLASVLWLVGKRSEARLLSEDAVKKLKKNLGGTHPYTLDAMDTLGRTLLHLGQALEAKELHQQVLEARGSQLGHDHPDTLMAMANLGMSLHALRELDAAEGLLDTVLRKRSRILGQEHAYTLWAVNDLAKIRCDQGRTAEAEGMLTGILEVVVRTLGEEHIGMSMTRQNLARTYAAQERWADTKQILLKLIEVQEKNMPAEHPDRIVSAMELAKATKHLGQLDEAEKMLKDIIEVSARVHGLKDRRTRKAMGQLAATYIAKSDFEKAEKLDLEIGKTSSGH